MFFRAGENIRMIFLKLSFSCSEKKQRMSQTFTVDQLVDGKRD